MVTAEIQLEKPRGAQSLVSLTKGLAKKNTKAGNQAKNFSRTTLTLSEVVSHGL